MNNGLIPVQKRVAFAAKFRVLPPEPLFEDFTFSISLTFAAFLLVLVLHLSAVC
jgi:hypothetical protein